MSGEHNTERTASTGCECAREDVRLSVNAWPLSLLGVDGQRHASARLPGAGRLTQLEDYLTTRHHQSGQLNQGVLSTDEKRPGDIIDQYVDRHLCSG